MHTGKEVKMTFKPAPIMVLLLFRVDPKDNPSTDANYVVNTQRGTNLEKLGLKFKLLNMF
jgi:UDP-3-O-[3-hydroxymyristoyl] N-acetylglucosamine deacetylase/3-hydroxyacyl-[acyl-carrier-protein] dehydratase